MDDGPTKRYSTALIRTRATGKRYYAIVAVEPNGEDDKEVICKSDYSDEIEALYNKFFSL